MNWTDDELRMARELANSLDREAVARGDAKNGEDHVNATDRARELGTEHGTRAAEEWWAVRSETARTLLTRSGSTLVDDPTLRALDWPKINTDKLPVMALTSHGYSMTASMKGAYEAAFTAAVEATIRQACSTAS